MSHSLLLYTLLVLWLLPAVALIAVYCTDVIGDKVRRWWMQWICHRVQRELSTHDCGHAVVSPRRSMMVGTLPAGAAAGHQPVASGTAARPYLVVGDAMHVPLVIEDDAGKLYTQQWTLSLN